MSTVILPFFIFRVEVQQVEKHRDVDRHITLLRKFYLLDRLHEVKIQQIEDFSFRLS
jgi:hypothetical protein